MRCRFLILIAWAPMFAGLSTSRDGSVLVFDISGKIIRWRSGVGTDTIGDRPAPPYVPLPSNVILPPMTGVSYYLQYPNVSSEGHRIYYAAAGSCVSRCGLASWSAWNGVMVNEDGREVSGAGLVVESPSGQFVHDTNIGSSPVGTFRWHNVTDRVSGSRVFMLREYSNNAPLLSGRVIGDNGSSLILRNSGVAWFSPEKPEKIGEFFPPGATHHGLRADGKVAFYLLNGEIRNWTLATGRHETVHRLAAGKVTKLDFDDSATMFVAILDGTPWLLFANGRAMPMLQYPQAGDVAVSGDGKVLYVRTEGRRFWRVVLDPASGSIREQTEVMWLAVQKEWEGVPGSQISFWWTGSEPWRGAQVEGIALPDIASGRTQLPWEFASRQAGETLAVKIASGTTAKLKIAAPKPVFSRIYREDQVTPVTTSEPARIGELVHIDTVGLGPVDQTVATGEPSPAEPLARAREVSCMLGNVPLDLHFAGLIPNAVGAYRISFVVPSRNPSVSCRVGDGAATAVQIPAI